MTDAWAEVHVMGDEGDVSATALEDVIPHFHAWVSARRATRALGYRWFVRNERPPHD